MLDLSKKSCLGNNIFLSFLVDFLLGAKSEHQIGVILCLQLGSLILLVQGYASASNDLLFEHMLPHVLLIELEPCLHPFHFIINNKIFRLLQSLNMVARMMIDLVRLLLVHNLVLVDNLSVFLHLCWFHETPLLKEFLFHVLVSEEVYAEFVFEFEEFFCFLGNSRLREV